MAIPSQCPQCAGLSVDVRQVPPANHDHGEQWITRIECQDCAFTDWQPSQ